MALWYEEGLLHREDGQPAREEYYEDGRVEAKVWYEWGVLLKAERFD